MSSAYNDDNGYSHYYAINKFLRSRFGDDIAFQYAADDVYVIVRADVEGVTAQYAHNVIDALMSSDVAYLFKDCFVEGE